MTLQRRAARIKQNKSIYIFCEGKTEKVYFDDLVKDFESRLVYVECKGQLGAPVSVVERAIQKKEENKSNSTDDNISYWAVFDRDDHVNIEFAFNLAIANDIMIGFTNPCFELWALLHFKDHDSPQHRSIIQQMLNEHMPSYHHDKNPIIDYSMIRGSRSAAVSRSERCRKRRQEETVGGIYPCDKGNPWCDVDELTELIYVSSLPISERLEEEAKIRNSILHIDERITATKSEIDVLASNGGDVKKMIQILAKLHEERKSLRKFI